MLRPGLLLALAAPILAACSTFAFPPARAMEDLAAMRRLDYPSFKGLGRVEMEEGGRKLSGVIHLALDGGRFRMEISHTTGKTVLALAGDGGKTYRMDTDTGEKTELKDGFPLAGNIAAPWALVYAMVTGAPPPVSGLKSTRMEGGTSVATASDPAMTFHYREGRLLLVEGAGPVAYTLRPGPVVDGPLAPYIKWAELKFRGGMMRVEWVEAGQGTGFPEGFFSFEDSSPDF